MISNIINIAFVGVTAAQNSNLNLSSIPQNPIRGGVGLPNGIGPGLRTMSKEWVVSIYSRMLENNATDQSTRLFASALRERAENSGVPIHVYEAIINELSNDNGNGMDRSVQCGDGGCTVPMNLQKIWNYGCWCNMGQNLLKGVGQTVDEYDSACHNMQRCLRCAEMDAQIGGYECNPRTDEYKASMRFSEGTMSANCDSLNPGNDCGKSLCMCETQFISEILDNLWNGAVYDSRNLHDNGFERDANCMRAIAGQPVYECCGLYPKRFPYNVNQQDCCTDDVSFGKAYQPATQECCDGQRVADLASCP